MHKEQLTDKYSDEPACCARQPELQLPARILHPAADANRGRAQ